MNELNWPRIAGIAITLGGAITTYGGCALAIVVAIHGGTPS